MSKLIKTTLFLVTLLTVSVSAGAQDKQNKTQKQRQLFSQRFSQLLMNDEQATRAIVEVSFNDYRQLITLKVDTLRSYLKDIDDEIARKEEADFVKRILPQILFRYFHVRRDHGLKTTDDDFAAFAENIDYNNEQNAHLFGLYAEWKYSLSAHNMPFTSFMMNTAENKINDRAVLNKLLFGMMESAIGGANPNELPEIWNTYESLCTDTQSISKLQPIYEQTVRLRRGSKLLDCVLKTPAGKEVHMMDVLSKDKLTCIDLWATWCAPCCMETPVIREMLKDVDDKVQFVSISMDSNGEKWKKQVAEEALPWSQYLLPDNFKSEFARYYGIQSIPRFLLIDKNSRIVNGNMPRPSQTRAFKDAVNNANVLRISGKLSDLGNDTLTICNYIQGAQHETQTKVVGKNGCFEATIPLDCVQGLLLAEIKEINGQTEFGFQELVAVPGDEVIVTGSMDSIQITGSYFYKQLNQVLPFQDIRSYQAYKEATLNYIKRNPGDEAASTLVSKLKDDDLLQALELLTPELREGRMSTYYEPLIDAVNTKKKLQQTADRLIPHSAAPDFKLPTLNGGMLQLTSLKGKYVILDFWGSWCVWCLKGLPKMKEYYQTYRNKMEILGIDCNDTEKKWRECVEKEEIPWLHVRQDNKTTTVTDAYGIQGFPTKVIINPDGTVNKIFRGESPEFYTYLDVLFK